MIKKVRSYVKDNNIGGVSVGDGEEGYDLVFEEGSEWFEKVSRYNDWNDKEWNEWDKLNCEGLKFEVDGKI